MFVYQEAKYINGFLKISMTSEIIKKKITPFVYWQTKYITGFLKNFYEKQNTQIEF